MAEGAPKQLNILYVLKLLQENTDRNHRLSQSEIQQRLEKKHGIKMQHTTLKNLLMRLDEAGFPIRYTKKAVMSPNNKTGKLEEVIKMTDFYYEQEFSDAELRLIIDSILSSKNIPQPKGKDLIKRIAGLSGKYFKTHVNHVAMMPGNAPHNDELFNNIALLDEAIQKNKKITCRYNRYDTDLKLHPTVNKNGDPVIHTLSPYQMAVANSRYYLICNNDWYNNVTHYRIDRMTDVTILDDAARKTEEIEGLKYGLSLPKHMAEHIYMFAGPSTLVHFIVKKSVFSDVVDWFGKDISIIGKNEDTIKVSVNVNKEAMKQWALQYAEHVTVTFPKELAAEIGRSLKKAADKYADL